MVKKAILLLSAAACLSGVAKAQSSCGTDDLYERIKKQHPVEVATYEKQLKEQMDRQLATIDIKKYAKTTAFFDTVYHVPIVFHIIHDYGAEYVTDDYVYAIVRQVNKMYAKQNADTTDIITPYKTVIPGTAVRYAAKANIVWHLATKDPQGRPTNGITRRRHYLTKDAGDQAKFDQWAPDSYMNVWLINKFGAENAGAGAYAYRPSTAAVFPYVYGDGVIGIYSQASDNGTIAHELGHELDLIHPWGSVSGLNGAQPPCGDDEVDDTPPTHGHTTGGGCSPANIYDTACATGYFKTYTKSQAFTYFGDSNATYINYPDTVNSQNIMDYTFCDKMFTHLQVFRMRKVLEGNVANRNHLISAVNLAATGALDTKQDLAPIVDFSLSKVSFSTNDMVYGCADGNVKFGFTDRSWNDTIASRTWTFGNGSNTPTSTLATVSNVTFTQPGWLSVTLAATGNGATGQTSTLTRNNAVYLADPNATNASGYFEEFTPGNGSSDKYPSFNYYDNYWKWEMVSNAGYYDNYSVRYKNFDQRLYSTSSPYPSILTGTPKGDLDDLFTPAFDLSSPDYATNCNLNFMSAGAFLTTNPSDMNDTLEIAYSINCGTSWTVFKYISKSDLANNGALNYNFVPGWMGAWKLQSIALPTAAKTNKTMFRFRYRPGVFLSANTNINYYTGSGNNFYMDRLNISGFPTGVDQDAMRAQGMSLVPNPTTGGSTLVVNKGAGAATMIVTDVTGKVVYRTEQQLNNNVTRIAIPESAIQVKGMYMVQLISGNKTQTEKLVVY